MNQCLRVLTLTIFVCASGAAHADLFWMTGKITRTLAEGYSYGHCMIQLDQSINNGCPSSGWVSLDCKGTFYPPETGDRKFSSALVAFTQDTPVSLYIDNTKKHSGYCVARRIDLKR